MKSIIQTDLSVLQDKERQLKEKDAQLQNLGVSLAQEKAKNVQKDAMLQNLGQQIAQLRVEVITLKGVVNQ